MSDQQSSRMRLYFTALVMLAEFAHLASEHFNGGVQSHHVLNRADLPAISNWLGAALLPALTWFLTGRISKRTTFHSINNGSSSRALIGMAAGFVASLTFGVVLSVAYTHDYSAISSNMFLGALVIALFLPVYRAECVLGFVLGMTFTFGAVLPTIVGSVIAAISALFNVYVHPVLFWVTNSFERNRAIDPERVRGLSD